jgi:hypothetical protein
MKKQKKQRASAPRKEIKDLEPREEQAADVTGGTTVSNVLKTRHDTAKNTISNVR